jgi:L-asparaginase / beta-aspartyl-peptidase
MVIHLVGDKISLQLGGIGRQCRRDSRKGQLEMRTMILAIAGLAALGGCTMTTQFGAGPPKVRTLGIAPPPAWSIAIHGGAGVIERKNLTVEQDRAYRAALAQSIEIGATILREGGAGLDAIEAVAKSMEDNPLFNAGRGGAIDASGKVTLDAAIMVGPGLKAGSVAGVTTTRHPISAARAVMEKTRHVFLAGEGADAFAREQNLEQVPNSFFITAKRWGLLEDVLRAQGLPIPTRPAGLTNDPPAPSRPSAALSDEARFGTIGIVVRDTRGVIAAGTSTGGLTGKRWGRIGDVPVIGAGTYATPTCGVSGTGTGEFFIRLGVARTICDRVAVAGTSLQAGADEVMKKDLTAIGGDGGVIVVNARGELAFSMNTPGMYRASLTADAPLKVAIYADEN